MTETSSLQPELPNILTILENKFSNCHWLAQLRPWENVIFSLGIVLILSVLAYLASRKSKPVPEGLQNVAEIIVGGLDDFICGVLGPRGRKYTPFIGTLFIYILCMNLSGLIPFIKSSTASWSTTMALALCVFLYVQYTSFKELGFKGYMDHLMGKPRGFLALSLFYPLLMFILHLTTELIRPITLSLRLRSNIWGDDLLLAILAGFGIKGVPLLIFSSFIIIIAAVVQAVVFCLLTTIYFALVLTEEETTTKEV